MNEDSHDIDPALQGALAQLEGLMEPQVQTEAVEITQVRELRQQLGLPEKSPLLYEPPTEEQKRAILDPFYQERLDKKIQDGEGYIDRNRKLMEKLRHPKRQESARAVQLAALALEKVGISNARQYIDVFNDRSLFGNEARYLPDLISLSRTGLTPMELGTAIDRLASFGFSIHSPRDLKEAFEVDSRFKDLLKTYGSADEDVFQSLSNDMNKYYFLNSGDRHFANSYLVVRNDEKDTQYINPNVRFFAEVLENKGLSIERKRKFDYQLRKSLLSDNNYYAHIVTQPANIDSWENSTQVIELAEELVYQWLQDPTIEKDEIVLRSQYFNNLAIEYEQLHPLLSHGIKIPFENLVRLAEYRDEYLERALKNAANIITSESSREWIALFQELRERGFVDGIYPDQLEGLYENRYTYADVALVMNELKSQIDLNFSELFERGYEKNIYGGALDVIASKIYSRIYTPEFALELRQLGPNEIPFISAAEIFTSKRGAFLAPEDMATLAFLARNKDDLSKYILRWNGGAGPQFYVKSALIEAAARGEFEASESTLERMFHSYHDVPDDKGIDRQKVKPEIILQFNKSIDVRKLPAEIARMSPDDISSSPYLSELEKELFLAVNKYQDFGNFLLINREKYHTFFTKGNPTSEFFIYAAESMKVNYSTLISTLDDNRDILNSFSPIERQFWELAIANNSMTGMDIGYISKSLITGTLSYDLAINILQSSPVLWSEEMYLIRKTILNESAIIIRDTSDIRFINDLVGKFGLKSEGILFGYIACLKHGVITLDDKNLVSEFLTHFRVLSPTIISGYKEAKTAGHAEVYLSQLKNVAEAMTGSRILTEVEREQPYYNDLIHHVYPHNAGQWATYEGNAKCEDRTDDLDKFIIQPKYEIDLLSQSVIRLKENQTTDNEIKSSLQNQVYDVASFLNENGHDKEKILGLLEEQIDNQLALLQDAGRLSSVDLSELGALDEKLFLLLAENAFGKPIDPNLLKRLIITYEFAMFEDITDYIQGTNDRVSRSSNPDYALFCELSTFYGDRIKEVNRKLTQAGFASEVVGPLMHQYFQELANGTANQARIDQINRLRVDQLGLSDNFIDQVRPTLETKSYSKKQLRRIGQLYRTFSGTNGDVDSELVEQIKRTLSQRRKQEYSDDQIRTMIHDYEATSEGLTIEPQENDRKSQILHRQLASQRKKTFDALMTIDGTVVNPANVHLGEINLQEALQAEVAIREGTYNEQQFASYTAQKLVGIFAKEQSAVHTELSKFESESGKEREVLYGYITKTKESANARMVGGVCVSGDNPPSKDNLWDMPNYFQLVLQDPDTLQCQGLVLLHLIQEPGPDAKTLTASFNPSQTYLYTVDEQALFKGLLGTLEKFAQDNNIHRVVVSQNKAIRTNRTGGAFEQAMDNQIRELEAPYNFRSPQVFSYRPEYQMKDMDTIYHWFLSSPK